MSGDILVLFVALVVALDLDIDIIHSVGSSCENNAAQIPDLFQTFFSRIHERQVMLFQHVAVISNDLNREVFFRVHAR